MRTWWRATGPRSSRLRGVSAGGGRGLSLGANTGIWYCPDRVVIAHRFAYAMAYGVAALRDVEVLGHRCDNPLCQRVGDGHVVASSYVENRREWAARKELSGSPLGDPRGSRRRARELRDLAKQDPGLVAADLARLRRVYGEQLALW